MFKTLITATLAATAATLLAASAPAAAQSPAVGDLSAGVGWVSIQGTPPSETNVTFTSVGRGNKPLGMNWNLEGQADVKSLFQQQGGNKSGAAAQADAYAHLWGRYPNAAFGMFLGTSPVNPILTSLGGEIKGYSPRAAFGAAAAATFMNFGHVTATGWTLNLYGNFFFNPNIRLGIRGAVLRGVGGLSPAVGLITDTVWVATLDYEQRIPSFPLSLWVALSRVQAANPGSSLTMNSWVTEGGIRFFLDKPNATLQSHDRDVPFTFILPSLTAY
jgi:hypothetical protein